MGDPLRSAMAALNRLSPRRYRSVDEFVHDVSPEAYWRQSRGIADEGSFEEELLKLGSAITLNLGRRYDPQKVRLEEIAYGGKEPAGYRDGIVRLSREATMKEGLPSSGLTVLAWNSPHEVAFAAELARTFGVELIGEVKVDDVPAFYFALPTGDLTILPHVRRVVSDKPGRSGYAANGGPDISTGSINPV